jgi:hypothetical protein
VAAGPHNTLAVFGAPTGNAKGWAAVIPGVLYAVFGWMILGAVLLCYFLARDRSRIADTRRVFTEEPPEQREAA